MCVCVCVYYYAYACLVCGKYFGGRGTKTQVVIYIIYILCVFVCNVMIYYVYACLVCGKYFGGRGTKTQVFIILFYIQREIRFIFIMFMPVLCVKNILVEEELKLRLLYI